MLLFLRLLSACCTGSAGAATRQIDPTQPVATGHYQAKYCCTADDLWSTRKNHNLLSVSPLLLLQLNSLFQKNVKVRVIVNEIFSYGI